MEDNIRFSMLAEIYGKLLTQKQILVIEDYYNNDFSLAEIAENMSITPQGVRDILKASEHKLTNLEESLGLLKASLKNKEKIKTSFLLIEKIKEEIITDKEKALDTIDKLAKVLREE